MPSSSDRNVLFGVLALQMEFITQAGLIAALQAWTLQKTKPLGELLVELGHMSADDRAALEPMVDRHVAKHGGNAEHSLAALSSVSEVADELRELSDADVQHSLQHISAPPSREAGQRSRLAPRDEQPNASPDSIPSSNTGAAHQPDALARAEGSIDDEDMPPQLQPTIVETQQESPHPAMRFLLLRPHAEGGLGKVWIARDRELNREVAFKEIKSKRASDKNSRGRFVLEAEITGGLEHPGIVPVYGLGHFDDGRPFYAMRFIRGQSLKEAIEKFHFDSFNRKPEASAPASSASSENAHASGLRLNDSFESLEFRKLIQRLIDVCNAIAYAHSRGVLHRDLKPGNIMLGKYGETLVVDWGLARAKGQSFDPAASATDSLDLEPNLSTSGSHDVASTQMGSAIGTPQFMSPEQAAGRLDVLGPASDIYSLGATLYQLLTGQAPFAGLGIAEVLRRVQAGDLLRPRDVVRSVGEPEGVSPRTKSNDPSAPSSPGANAHRLAIPLALEAICLKAMSREPARRYATAQAMAEDLERWLAGDPVSAWREPLLVRAKRWVRRHQTLVTSAAAVLLVSIASLTGLSVIVTGKNNDLNSANTRISRQSDKISEQNASLETANTQLTQANSDLKQANESERLAKADAHAKRVLAETNEQLARDQSQLALSTLNSIIFDVQRSLQNVPGGAEVRQRMLATVLPQLDKVSTQFIAKSVVDRRTMVALIDLGDTILELQSSAHASRQESRASNDAPHQNEDPTTYSAVLTAERIYLRAREIGQQLAAAKPNDSNAQSDLSGVIVRLGDVFLKLGRADDALTQFQEFAKMCQVLAESDPSDAQKQRSLSTSFNRLGIVFLRLGRTDNALTYFDESMKISRALAEADPHDTQKHRELSSAIVRLGDVFLKRGRLNDAVTQFQEYAKMCRALAEADPGNAQKQRDLSISFERLGDVFLKLGRTDEALTQFQAKQQIDLALVQTDPKHTENQKNLAVSFDRLGGAFLKLGRTRDALTQFEEHAKICRARAEADPGDAEKQNSFSISFDRLGDVFLMLGRTDDALKQFEDGLKFRRVRAEADPHDVETQRGVAGLLDRLGNVFLKLGRTDDALTQFTEGMKISRALANADPRDTQMQHDLSIWFERFGDVFLKLGRTDDALAQFTERMKISRSLTDADPTNAEAQFDHYISLAKIGTTHQQASQFETASEWYRQALEILTRLDEAKRLAPANRSKIAVIQKRIQVCNIAKLAFGDWDALLKVDAKVLPQLLPLRATEMLKRGELASAVQAGDKLRELDSPNKTNLYNAACVYAQCAEFVIKDKPTPTDAEQAERKEFLDRSLATLQEALAAGWDDFEHLRKDDDLKPLRGLPEFEVLFPKKEKEKEEDKK